MTALFLKGRQEKQVLEQEKTPDTEEGRAEKWKSPQAEKHRPEPVKEEYSAPKEVQEVERKQMTQLLSGRQPVRPGRKDRSLLGKETSFVIWIRLHIQEKRMFSLEGSIS